jgi:hypothetical protein
MMVLLLLMLLLLMLLLAGVGHTRSGVADRPSTTTMAQQSIGVLVDIPTVDCQTAMQFSAMYRRVLPAAVLG